MIILFEKGHNPGGVHAYFRSIRVFLRWYEDEDEPVGWNNPINKVRAPIVPITPLEPISMQAVRTLMCTCDKADFYSKRDSAILLFLLDTGARALEFLNVNIADIDLISGIAQIREGKGRKPRIVYFGNTTRKALRKYLKARKDNNPSLWVNRNGNRLRRAGLREILRRRAKRANISPPSPHDFRRAFAIERWRAGVDIVTLSKLMGHTSLTVLSRYLKQTGEDLEQVAKSSSPVDLHFL